MANRTYALVGRRGDLGRRYLTSQWPQMKAFALECYAAGDMLQVWRAMQNGDLLTYDGEATRRVSDYLVANRKAVNS